MEFEWDETKRRANLAKHGVDFIRARMLFDGRPTLTRPSKHIDEVRWIKTGSIDGTFLTTIWTWREGRVRLISARRARREEERAYRQIYG